MYLDNRHVVRSLVLNGIVDPDIVACIAETMFEEEAEEMENLKFGTSHLELKSLCGICVERSSQA